MSVRTQNTEHSLHEQPKHVSFSDKDYSMIADIVVNKIDLQGVAKEANATLNRDEVLAAIALLSNGLTDADKVWLQQQFAAIDLSSVNNRLDNNTYGLQALKNAIAAIPTTPISGYAKEEQVKDGADTAISVSKAVKTETDKIGSPTSATNDTLFKAIENIQFPTGIATEANATANKNELKTFIEVEATEAEIYAMFLISGTAIPTNASVSGTTATIQGSVSGTTATIQGSVIF